MPKVMLNVFQIVADPTRRGILDLLRERDRSVGEIVERFTISQPAVSRHLRDLREAGLVTVRRAGQRRIYVLRAEPLVEIAAWVDRFRALS
jgi:DNA-binding transcriptional ArsR family regulator